MLLQNYSGIFCEQIENSDRDSKKSLSLPALQEGRNATEHALGWAASGVVQKLQNQTITERRRDADGDGETRFHISTSCCRKQTAYY